MLDVCEAQGSYEIVSIYPSVCTVFLRIVFFSDFLLDISGPKLMVFLCSIPRSEGGLSKL